MAKLLLWKRLCLRLNKIYASAASCLVFSAIVFVTRARGFSPMVLVSHFSFLPPSRLLFVGVALLFLSLFRKTA